MQENIAKAVVSADTLSPDGIQARLVELQQELIKRPTTSRIMTPSPTRFSGSGSRRKSEVDSHSREEAMNRIKELQDFIAGQKTAVTDLDEDRVKRLIEKLTVFADHFTVEFKSGISIDITE